ncbi:MAG: extracellular solute-binding protein [Eubacteriales bacterium]|nr:extracellular solute-binding protein [Eubacteriales bacterium]
MKKKIVTTLLTATMVAGSLAGGSQMVFAEESEEPVTIRFAWWGSQDRADKTNKAVELFMKKNPDIIVETSFYPFDSYYENLSISATSDNMPDVFQGFIGAGDCMQYMTEGLMEPLDEYIESGLIDTSSISESLLDTGIYDGKNYGISLDSNVKCMIVDPDIYEEAGLEIPEVAKLIRGFYALF